MVDGTEARNRTAVPEERFLAWAEHWNGRYELAEGEIMMQAGATRDRARVAKRICMALASQVDETDRHVEKLALDAGRATLRQDVVSEQTKPKAYIWIRNEAGWAAMPEVVEGIEAVVAFPSVGADVKLAEVYRPVEPRGRSGTRA